MVNNQPKMKPNFRKQRVPRKKIADLTLPASSRNRPFPSTYRTRLTYATTYNLNPSPGAISWAKIRANSLFDPDYATGGHQPLGFDELQVLYGRYAVLRAVAKFTIVSNQSSVPFMAVCGTFSEANFDTAIVTHIDAMENPRVQTKLVSRDGGANSASLSQSYDVKKVSGIPHEDALGSFLQSAEVTANPTLSPIFGFGVAAQLSTDDPISQVVQIVVTYDAVFGDPYPLTKST